MHGQLTEGKSRQSKAHRHNLARVALYNHFADKLSTNHELSRALVSFQANKSMPFYRWFKYKEAFSSELVEHFINNYRSFYSSPPSILDPFAGAGTTVTTARRNGWRAVGIEIMPVGVAAIKARLLADTIDIKKFQKYLDRFQKVSLSSSPNGYRFPHITITKKAFSRRAETNLSAFMAFLRTIQELDIRYLFWFACLSVLEDISYTRKDGQYLRWDNRSGKSAQSSFRKPTIHTVKVALTTKLRVMLDDIKQRAISNNLRDVEIIEGSCLDTLPTLQDNSFDMVLTSPPYCNRYDYSRTYALELAFLGLDELAVKNLRQSLLSATVENKSKRDYLVNYYKTKGRLDMYTAAQDAFESENALHEILWLLNKAKARGELNNNNIPNMIENYFFEMNITIHELARVLSPKGRIIMVNDNVRYHGEEIPVDLILSSYAKRAGLDVEKIWVLKRGKGNSSQQMGAFGRNELRKGIYVWVKPLTNKRGGVA